MRAADLLHRIVTTRLNAHFASIQHHARYVCTQEGGRPDYYHSTITNEVQSHLTKVDERRLPLSRVSLNSSHEKTLKSEYRLPPIAILDSCLRWFTQRMAQSKKGGRKAAPPIRTLSTTCPPRLPPLSASSP